MLPDDYMLKQAFEGLDLQGLSPEKLYRLAHCSDVVLDVDDTFYPIDNLAHPDQPGIHDLIKKNIISRYRTSPTIFKEAVAQKLAKYSSNEINAFNLREQDLGVAFPIIVQTIKELFPNYFFELLNNMYGDFYEDHIAPDPVLVAAIEDEFKKAGMNLYLWTNGPSSNVHGEDMHVQKVLRRLGFSDVTIEALKDNTYDLIKSTQDGFGKPDEENWEKMLDMITGDHKIYNFTHVLVVDDGIKNLAYPRSLSHQALWIQGSEKKPPSQSDLDDAQELGITRIKDLGSTLHLIAEVRIRLKELKLLSSPIRDYDALKLQDGP